LVSKSYPAFIDFFGSTVALEKLNSYCLGIM
jgi:hypothetical protein